MRNKNLLHWSILTGLLYALAWSPAAAEAGNRGWTSNDRPAVKQLKKIKKGKARKAKAYRARRGAKAAWVCSVKEPVRPRRGGVSVWGAAEPFYFHAGSGLYLSGPALEFCAVNVLPAGVFYVHIDTGRRFASVGAFKRWCARNPGHRPYLTVVSTRCGSRY